jgi:CheY-like chemotaxis protein
MRRAFDGVEAELSAGSRPSGEAPEHPFSRAREARSRSETVREGAAALQAQSDHQLRRAKRNLAAARVDVGKVLVVDDSQVFRQVAHSVLAATTRLRPFGEAATGEEAIGLLPDLKPDLVLLDVHMPGLDGVETAEVIHRESPATVVVLMSADADGLGEAARSAHAVAVLDKTDLFPQTLDEIWLQHRPERRD